MANGARSVTVAFQFALDSSSVGFDTSLTIRIVFGLIVIDSEMTGTLGLYGLQPHDHPLSCPCSYPMCLIELGIPARHLVHLSAKSGGDLTGR